MLKLTTLQLSIEAKNMYNIIKIEAIDKQSKKVVYTKLHAVYANMYKHIIIYFEIFRSNNFTVKVTKTWKQTLNLLV